MTAAPRTPYGGPVTAQVIVLNGGSSSGKSTLARSLQAVLPEPWLTFGVDDFVDALRRVAAGGTALDPEVVGHLLSAGRHGVGTLTPREREVLGLMAEGRTNAAIAKTLVVSERAVEKHIANIFLKLDLPPSGDDHRRVLAVLRYLGV